MLERAQHLIRRAGKTAGLSEVEIDRILKADAEHTFEIELDNGKKLPAFRVQHSNKRGPYKGGIRFHKDVSHDGFGTAVRWRQGRRGRRSEAA
jgi:glutamate dehydrogenase/leucine dehydrogenase